MINYAMNSVFYTLLTFCIAFSMTCCSPAEVDDKPGGGETEEPEKPEEPAPPKEPEFPQTPDPDLPDNPIEERFSCDFTATAMPQGYQTINANNLEVVQPSTAKIPMPMDPDDPTAVPDLRPFVLHPGYENSTQPNWHSYQLKDGKYALTSYACDGKKNTKADNWLITTGIDISSSKALIQWKMCAAVDFDFPYPEFYEVYISTSPELSSFTTTGALIYKNETYHNHIGNDQINKVDYLLEGYKDKTIYLAFRHTSPGAEKIGITLHKLTVSDFLLDEVDVEASQANCWWDCKPAKVTGVNYPIGAELTPEITILNQGYHLEKTTFKVSYTYAGKTVTETTPAVSVKQGKTYSYQFKEKLVYNGEPGFTVTVYPLPGETRLYSNRCNKEGLTTVKRPVMIRVLYEEASGQNCSVCSTLFRALDDLDAAYPGRTVGVMHIVDREVQRPYPAATGNAYKNFVASKSRPNQAPPYAAANRDEAFKRDGGIMPGLPPLARKPNLETPLIEDYTSVCYTPLEITATHRFSDDGRKMFVDVEVEALLDLEGLNYGIGGLVVEDNVQHKTYTMLNLGAPVFNHLARGVLGDMEKGVTGVIPATMTDGQKVTHTFEYDIPEKYDVLTPNRDQLYAVVMLIRPDKSILTCNKTTKKAAGKAAYR